MKHTFITSMVMMAILASTGTSAIAEHKTIHAYPWAKSPYGTVPIQYLQDFERMYGGDEAQIQLEIERIAAGCLPWEHLAIEKCERRRQRQVAESERRYIEEFVNRFGPITKKFFDAVESSDRTISAENLFKPREEKPWLCVDYYWNRGKLCDGYILNQKYLK